MSGITLPERNYPLPRNVEKPSDEENDLLGSENENESHSKEEDLLQKVGNTMAQTMATMMTKMFEQQMESLKTISKKKNEDSDNQKSPEKTNDHSRCTSMPSFSVPKVHKEDLLTGSKNLNKWKKQIGCTTTIATPRKVHAH